MPMFTDLPGGPKILEAKAFNKPRQMRQIIKQGLGAFAAGENGSVSVWRDSNGQLRADLQRFQITEESEVFKSIAACERWIAPRLLEIKKPNDEARRRADYMRESLGWISGSDA